MNDVRVILARNVRPAVRQAVIQLLERADQARRGGDLALAQKYCRDARAADPEFADAHHMFALIALQRRDFSRAVNFCRRAIQCDNTRAEFHQNLGRAHKGLGELEAAVNCFRRALELAPESVDSHTLHGIACRQLGRAAEALQSYRTAARLAPASTAAHINLGNLEFDQSNLDAALESYRRAIWSDPLSAPAHFGLARVARANGDLLQAEAEYRRAIELQPLFAEAHCNLGGVLLERSLLTAAIASLERAIELQPSKAEAHEMLGRACEALEDYSRAAEGFAAAMRLQPDNWKTIVRLAGAWSQIDRIGEARALLTGALARFPDAPELHVQLGVVEVAARNLEAAGELFERALAMDSQRCDAVLNLGLLALEHCRHDDARTKLMKVVEREPQNAYAHFSLGVTLLAQGKLQEGWEHYEWRLREAKNIERIRYSQPQWRGEDIRGRRILVHVEQGLGDNIQFIRYVPKISQRGATVYLACVPVMRRLFSRIEGVERLIVEGEVLPEFDLHCPIMSLSCAFGTNSPAEIPAEIPYLRAEPELVSAWNQRLKNYSAPRIGLAWAGNPKYAADRRRSIPPAMLAALAETGGQFVSLQKGGVPMDVQTQKALQLLDVGNDLSDLAETAALIMNLDLVICVDTAVAHLAGALGKQVWMLSRFDADWRWLIDREDSPWYPTMRIFRQHSPGDWEDVISRVSHAIRASIAMGEL